jgi:hypothetical protein
MLFSFNKFNKQKKPTKDKETNTYLLNHLKKSKKKYFLKNKKNTTFNNLNKQKKSTKNKETNTYLLKSPKKSKKKQFLKKKEENTTLFPFNKFNKQKKPPKIRKRTPTY